MLMIQARHGNGSAAAALGRLQNTVALDTWCTLDASVRDAVLLPAKRSIFFGETEYALD